jgi:hypothetical protein
MALAMPIPACEHSTFAIGRRASTGGFGVGVGAAAQQRTAGMGLARRFQQAPEVLLRTVPRRSARRGIVFCDVQSSARRSARGAGNHRLRSEFSRHKKELRNTLASAGSREPIFSAFREPRPRDSVCFAGRASRPSPSPSEVRPFEPRCQQHRGSLHLRLRCLGIPHSPGLLPPRLIDGVWTALRLRYRVTSLRIAEGWAGTAGGGEEPRLA